VEVVQGITTVELLLFQLQVGTATFGFDTSTFGFEYQ